MLPLSFWNMNRKRKGSLYQKKQNQQIPPSVSVHVRWREKMQIWAINSAKKVLTHTSLPQGKVLDRTWLKKGQYAMNLELNYIDINWNQHS